MEEQWDIHVVECAESGIPANKCWWPYSCCLLNFSLKKRKRWTKHFQLLPGLNRYLIWRGLSTKLSRADFYTVLSWFSFGIKKVSCFAMSMSNSALLNFLLCAKNMNNLRGNFISYVARKISKAVLFYKAIFFLSKLSLRNLYWVKEYLLSVVERWIEEMILTLAESLNDCLIRALEKFQLSNKWALKPFRCEWLHSSASE